MFAILIFLFGCFIGTIATMASLHIVTKDSLDRMRAAEERNKDSTARYERVLAMLESVKAERKAFHSDIEQASEILRGNELTKSMGDQLRQTFLS